jgi:Leucine-rich repeat (LRR) protein
VGNESLKGISDADLPSLVTLWLSFNKISSVGVEYFSQKNWKQLQKLHLAGNRIGEQGAAALAGG